MKELITVLTFGLQCEAEPSGYEHCKARATMPKSIPIFSRNSRTVFAAGSLEDFCRQALGGWDEVVACQKVAASTLRNF